VKLSAPIRALVGAAALAVLVACGDAGPPGSPDSPRSPRSIGGAERALLDAPAEGSGNEIFTVWDLDIPGDAPRVVFLGDSIAAGLHLAEHEAFPAILQVRLVQDGLPFDLVNASESGRTTAGGLTTLPWVMQREPDLVVLELGGNDGLRGVDLDVIETNLRELATKAREGGARVLLLGMRLPPNYGDYGEAFDAIYPRLAEEIDVAFEPYFMREVGGVADMTLKDGLHPTAKGQVRLADNVEPALRAALRELERP